MIRWTSQARGDALVQHDEELHEGDGVVAPYPLGDDLPVRHVHGSDDRDGPVPDDSNSRRASLPARHGYPHVAGLRLDAGLLVDADQHGAGRRVQVEAAYRPGLRPEAGSSARFSQPLTLCGRTCASASTRPTAPARCPGRARPDDGRSHRATRLFPRPPGSLSRTRLPRAAHPPVALRPARARLVEIRDAAHGEPAPPFPHRLHAAVQVTGDALVPSLPPSASAILARSTSRCRLAPAPMLCSSFRFRSIVIRAGPPPGPPSASSPASPGVIVIVIHTEECTTSRTGSRYPPGVSRYRPGHPGQRDTDTHAVTFQAPQGTRRENRRSPRLPHSPSSRAANITIRWRGSFGYMDAWAGKGDDNDARIPPPASSTSATRLGLRDLPPRHRTYATLS